MFTLKEQLQFLQGDNPSEPGTNPEAIAPASHLENKLDQIIRELAEVKNLLAKPAGERE